MRNLKGGQILIWVGIFVLVGFFGWKTLGNVVGGIPGESVADLGREHVTDIYGVSYNSSPPTSGPHFPIWAKKGLYDRVLSDGYLIHSLEHGYIVISYNCARPISNRQSPISNIYAHGDELVATDSAVATESATPLVHMNMTIPSSMGGFTPETAPPVEVELSAEFQSESCKGLVEGLKEMLKVAERVVVVPRPANETLIAVTAWNRILKLDKFDKKKIEGFIRAWNNKGPEKTVE